MFTKIKNKLLTKTTHGFSSFSLGHIYVLVDMKYMHRNQIINDILVLRFHEKHGLCRRAYMSYTNISQFVNKSKSFVRSICVAHTNELLSPSKY